LLASGALVVDASRHVVMSCVTRARWSRSPSVRRCSRSHARWAKRGPETYMLVARAFGAKRANESHRARLRVEVGRLRTVLRTLAA
jgi:hypothetical protein